MSAAAGAERDAGRTRPVHMLTTLALVCAGGYLLLVLLLFLFQAKLIYFPEVGREAAVTPLAAGLEFEEVWLDVAPDARIHGWYVPAPRPRGVALILHGNAGSIAQRIDWLRMFHRLGYASFIIDYRGYGRSSGTPSEAGTYADAAAAWGHLVQARGWKARDIVMVGESLGGAVAAHQAARHPPRALILQSTFTSIPDLAAELYRFVPVRWISRFRYDTRARMAEISAPVLVAHSRGDELVPYTHGEALYTAARGVKRFVELHGGHNEAALFGREEATQALARFLDAAGQPY